MNSFTALQLTVCPTIHKKPVKAVLEELKPALLEYVIKKQEPFLLNHILRLRLQITAIRVIHDEKSLNLMVVGQGES